jgi:hypothetical protein
MNYNTLIETIKIIINDDNFYTKGLTMVYSMDVEKHKKVSEHFFYKLSGDSNNNYEYTEEFEVEIGGILIKFVIND